MFVRDGSFLRDLVTIVVVGMVFRVPALLTDFWFDEIYSYERLARTAESIADIFFGRALKHDNNHQVNTMVLYLLGEQANWLLYRVPGTVAGFLALAAVVLIGRRRSRTDGLVTGLMVAASFIVSVYSTEARGYAWLLAFVSVGFLALDRYLSERSRRGLLVFWLCTAAGMASHPTFLQFYGGALLWSGYRLRRARGDLLRLHAIPGAWVLAWAVLVARGSVVGGGPQWTWARLGDEALAWTFGYPLDLVPPLIVVLALGLIIVWDARRLWTEGSDEGLFYLGAIAGPIVLTAALSPPFVFPRYFLVPLVFALIVVARRLAVLIRRSGPPRWLAAALLLTFVAGNGMHLASWSKERRWNVVAALVEMTERAQDDPVKISSWSLDQWTELPLSFYAPRLGLAGRVQYVNRRDLPSEVSGGTPVRWMTEVTPPCTDDPPARRQVAGTTKSYVLVRRLPICGPSGMSWYLYEHSPP